MLRPYDEVERVAAATIGCAIEVHRILGAGLLESVYVECLEREVRARGLFVERERIVPIVYKGQRLRPDRYAAKHKKGRNEEL
jgi:GxxExxY protein